MYMTTVHSDAKTGTCRLASRPSPPQAIPYGLVSLWDMINYSPAVSHSFLSLVAGQEGIARRRAALGPGEFADDDAKREANNLLTLCANGFGLLNSHAIRERIEGFERRLQFEPLWSDLGAELLSLHDTIEAELKQHHFYHYPRDRGDKVAAFRAEWGGVWPSCKLVQDEALAAVDCYAMDHPTASVFHSMRVAEHGLRALAYERGIKKVRKRPIEWGNWKDIIKALGDAADAIENKRINTKGAGTKRDADVAFYRGAIGDLDSFRVEFRNMVMHVRATYDHLQALRALERVREFMVRVAARMDENGKRHKQ